MRGMTNFARVSSLRVKGGEIPGETFIEWLAVRATCLWAHNVI